MIRFPTHRKPVPRFYTERGKWRIVDWGVEALPQGLVDWVLCRPLKYKHRFIWQKDYGADSCVRMILDEGLGPPADA